MGGPPNFIKQQKVRDCDTFLDDSNTPLLSSDRASKLKINKETSELKHATNQQPMQLLQNTYYSQESMKSALDRPHYRLQILRN